MRNSIRLVEKPYFVWDSILFQGGYEFGCSVENDAADRFRRLVEEDDVPLREEEAESMRTQDGDARFCTIIRVPRPLTPLVRRFPIMTTEALADAMLREDDVQVTFGRLGAPAYLQLLGTLELHEEPKGESCYVLTTPTGRIVLCANRPPMLIRISALPGEHSPLPAA